MEPDVISSEYSPKVGITADPRKPAMVQAVVVRMRVRTASRSKSGIGGFGFSRESAAQYPRQAVPQALSANAASRNFGGRPSIAAIAVPTAASAPAHVVRLIMM